MFSGTTLNATTANLTKLNASSTILTNATTTGQLYTLGQTYLATSGGNVGIGTTTMGSKLTIQGGDNTSGTSALNVTDSTGKTLFLVRDDGLVSIGNSAPGYLLDVSGNIRLGGNIIPSADNFASFDFRNAANNQAVMAIDTGDGGIAVGTGYAASFNTPTNGAIIQGRVGIGVSAPNYQLEVSGTASTTNLTVAAAATTTNLSVTTLTSGNCVQAGPGGLLQSASGACGSGSGSSGPNFWSTSTNATYNNFGYMIGINSSTPTANLVVQGSSTNASLPILRIASSSGASYLTVLSNGTIGVGTTTTSGLLSSRAPGPLTKVC